MLLEGIHHITAITGDAPRNVEFYAGTLGLRLVKKTVNFDAPDVYHLYFGSEHAAPGSILTFFELSDAAPGRPGDGMVHRILWRVGSTAALDFWAERLAAHGVECWREADGLRFADFEGLDHELVVVDTPDPPLPADAPDISPEHALLGFEGARAYAATPARSAGLLTGALGFLPTGSDESAYDVAGEQRRASWRYDPPPPASGRQGAGSVHHIAWTSADADHEAWRDAVAAAGARPTPVIDRQYFHSIYLREPSGVLFELATPSPGFAVDEPEEHLGEALCLPPQYEARRGELERSLTPLPDPRSAAARSRR